MTHLKVKIDGADIKSWKVLVENPYKPIRRDSAMYFSVTVDVHIIVPWNGFTICMRDNSVLNSQVVKYCSRYKVGPNQL